jgi:hypothetical protein
VISEQCCNNLVTITSPKYNGVIKPLSTDYVRSITFIQSYDSCIIVYYDGNGNGNGNDNGNIDRVYICERCGWYTYHSYELDKLPTGDFEHRYLYLMDINKDGKPLGPNQDNKLCCGFGTLPDLTLKDIVNRERDK